MPKIKPLTPEMSSRHYFRLSVAVLNHAAAMKRVIGKLQALEVAQAVRELGLAVDALDRVVRKNSEERGYRAPKRPARRTRKKAA